MIMKLQLQNWSYTSNEFQSKFMLIKDLPTNSVERRYQNLFQWGTKNFYFSLCVYTNSWSLSTAEILHNYSIINKLELIQKTEEIMCAQRSHLLCCVTKGESKTSSFNRGHQPSSKDQTHLSLRDWWCLSLKNHQKSPTSLYPPWPSNNDDALEATFNESRSKGYVLWRL